MKGPITKVTKVEITQRGEMNVSTFSGNELVRWNGGPHCMAMPLQRSCANGARSA